MELMPHSPNLRKSTSGVAALSRQAAGRSGDATPSAEEHLGRSRALAASGGQVRRRDAFWTVVHADDLDNVRRDVVIRLLVWECTKGNREVRADGAHIGHRLGSETGRRDRTRGNPVVLDVFEDHVSVTVVVLRGRSDLRPFESGECNQVRLLALGVDRIALAHRLLDHRPGARRQRFGVIGEGIEVELGAEACEVTRIGGRMHALPAHQGEAPLKRVHRQGGVHVQVAKENPCPRGVGDCALRFLARAQDGGVERGSSDLPIGVQITAPEHGPKSEKQQDEEDDRSEAPSLPNGHCAEG
jgi:hypothetical protein